MKISGFKQYINENIYNITPITAAGSVDIRNPDDIDQINTVLNFVTGDKFITPYVAFEKVQKVLAQYMIFPTKPPMFEGDSGLFTCPISQFGDKSGQELDGTMVKSSGFHGKDETHGSHEPGESFHGDGEKSIEKKDDETYHFYFEYRLSDCGMFRIFAEVVNDDELEELLGDLEDEMNDEEEESDDLQEENLQELSRGKLADYVTAASTDMGNRLKKSHQELSNATMRHNRGDKPAAVQAHADVADKEYKKASKRQAGIYKAVRKLAK